jgi:hypothetical protein
MKSYQELKAILNSLIPLLGHIPIAYLIGDTGSGKSSLIRQLLGTAGFGFPSALRLRTTVAPTEYVISSQAPLRAAFVLKSEKEILGHIEEIVEEANSIHYQRGLNGEVGERDLVTALGQSADERFRLRYILTVTELSVVAQTIRGDIIPKLHALIEHSRVAPQPLGPIIESELRRNLREEFAAVINNLAHIIFNRIREVCLVPLGASIPEKHVFDGDHDQMSDFIERVKKFLGTMNSISPVVERARISGNIKAPWLPPDTELIIVDSEGIGHNLQDQTLSSRHLDHFYDSDAILLIDDGSRAFVGQALTALRGIVENGYTPKLFLIFTHLDQVDADGDDRREQIGQVFPTLMNAQQALNNQGISLSFHNLHTAYLGELDREQPDEESKEAIGEVVKLIREKHRVFADQFIPPAYNYGHLNECLNAATRDFRECWNQYLNNPLPIGKPWQSVKAFNRRMYWEGEEYQDMKPVAQLHQALVKNLDGFLSRPDRWIQPIGAMKQESCLTTLKQEVSRDLLAMVREIVIYKKQPEWEEGVDLSGTGSTFVRSKLIYEIICDCAPEVTDNHHQAFADEIRSRIQKCINQCAGDAQ